MESVPLCVISLPVASEMYTHADFGRVLQNCGSDYTLYRNNGYESRKGEEPWLQVILADLLSRDDSGVEMVYVCPFSLRVRHSRAVSSEALQNIICNALRRAGYEPELRNQSGHPLAEEQQPRTVWAREALRQSLALWRRLAARQAR